MIFEIHAFKCTRREYIDQSLHFALTLLLNFLIPANYCGLNLIHNADQTTLGFLNVTQNVGISITAQEDGAVKLLLDSKTGHVLSFKHLDKVTFTQNDEFKGDVAKVLDLILENYVFKKEPIAGNSKEVIYSSEEALSVWSEVYLHLGHPKEKGSQDYRSLRYLQIFSKRLIHLYFGPLKGLIVGNGPFPLKENLNRFLTISIGLQKLFNQAPGGLKSILAKQINFEVNSLFNAKNGAEVFVYVLRQTGAKFDLSELWQNLLTNVDELLDILEKLGGGESKNGVDESVAVIGHIWAAIHLRISITDLVQFLFAASTEDHWSEGDGNDFQQTLKDLKNITDQQAKKYDNVIKLSGFAKFITNLTTNELIENNINISDLVDKWRKRDAIGGLKIITHIISKIFSPDKYSNLLFNGFTAFLNATSDKDAVKKLIPGVSLEDLTGNGAPIWKSICKNYQLDEKLKKGGNPTEVLNGVPIINGFSKVFKDVSGNPFDFGKVLNGGTFSDYLSKLSSSNPFNFGPAVFVKFLGASGQLIKHIFYDPIRHFLPLPDIPWISDSHKSPSLPSLPNAPSIPGLPNVPSIPGLPKLPSIPGFPNFPSQTISPSPQSPSLPFLPPGILPPGILPPGLLPVGPNSKGTEEIKKPEVTTENSSTKKPCDDCDENETKSPSTEKSTEKSSSDDEESKSPSAEKLTSPASEETHLTASVSTTSTPVDSEVTKTSDSSEKSTDSTTKKCDECEEDKDIKSSSIDADSTPTSTVSIEFKHHHNVKHHHENKHVGHKYRHHHSGIGNENKHHSRQHEKQHNTRRHHNNKEMHQDKRRTRNHYGEKQGDKLQARHHRHEHEVKHHQRTNRHVESHQNENYRKQDLIW